MRCQWQRVVPRSLQASLQIPFVTLANFIRGRATKVGSKQLSPTPKRKIPHPKNWVRDFWRGREDSNFRTGNPAYILSRDASYSLLSTPTSITAKTVANRCFNSLLYNYTQFFCLCQQFFAFIYFLIEVNEKNEAKLPHSYSVTNLWANSQFTISAFLAAYCQAPTCPPQPLPSVQGSSNVTLVLPNLKSASTISLVPE